MRALLPVATALVLASIGCKKASDSHSGGLGSAKQNSPAGTEPVELKVKWGLGNKYHFRLELAQTSETSFPQSPRPIKQDLTLGQDYSLVMLSERASGGAELEMQFGGTDMEVNMGGKPLFSYDSKGESLDDSQNRIASTFRNLDGAKVKVLLDASNSVEKVEGIKELQARVSGGSANQARGFLRQLFTEEYFKQMVPDNRLFPPGAIKTGDAWDAKMDIVMGPMGKTVLQTKQTLAGWEERQHRQCAVIDFSGTISSGTNSARMGGVAMSVKDGKASGKTWFDPALSMMVESSFEQTLNGEVRMPQKASTNTPSFDGRTKVTQKVSIKLAELEPAPQ